MRGFVGVPIGIMAVGLAIAFFATSGDDEDQASAGPSMPPVGREAPPEGTGVELPDLTDEQIARAEEILITDPRAQELLGGEDYTIEQWGPSIDSDSRSTEVQGASTLISFDRPISIEGSWPMVYPPGPGDPPGSSARDVLVHYSDCAAPNGVVKVAAVVDLRQDRLVQLFPLDMPGFDVLGTDC